MLYGFSWPEMTTYRLPASLPEMRQNLFLSPFSGLAYRLQPVGIKLLTPRRRHGWLEAPGSFAMRGDLRCVPPETHGQSRQVGGPAGSGLIDGRAHYGDAEDVGLELH